MNPKKVAKYFNALKEVIKDCQPEQIWNMGETGLQLNFKPHKIAAAKGTKYLHMWTSGNRETITTTAYVNAAGRALPPHVIPKGKTVKSLQSFQVIDAPEGTNWTPSESGWTKQGIAKLWFECAFFSNIGPQRRQLLILGGHDSHNFVELIDMAIQNQIKIVELPAYISNWLRPCDRTAFKPLKDAYSNAAQDMMSNQPGVITNKANFKGLLSKAWDKAMKKTNIEGFKSCGIFPYNPSAIPFEAYLPNYVYSADMLVTNSNLFNQVEAIDDTTTIKHVNVTTDNTKIISPDLALSEVDQAPFNLINNPISTIAVDRDYLAEPLPIEEIPARRDDGLIMMESSMEKQQLECFQYCLLKGFHLDMDPMFVRWKTIKETNNKAALTSHFGA